MNNSVALYLRVSTMDQVNGYGIDSQERQLRSYVEVQKELQGWDFNENFIYKDEGVSGASLAEDRTALSRLKQDVIDGKIKTVISLKIDRLFRKTSYLLAFIDFLKDHEVNYISITESLDLKSAVGTMFLAMLGSWAELERSTIAERTIQGKISKSNLGYLTYGKIVYGYKKAFDGRGYKMEIDEDDSKIIKKVFDLYVNEDKSTSYIRQYLNSLNIGTKYDKESNKKKITENFIHYSFVHKILSNETYVGRYYFRKRKTMKVNGKQKTVFRERKDWLSFDCPKIIDEELFLKAQKKLETGKAMNGRGETHYFTGLLKCECGKSFVYYKGKRSFGKYRCIGKNKNKSGLICTNSEISELKLLDLVWNSASKIFENPELFIKIYINKKDNKQELINEYTKEIGGLENMIESKGRIIRNGIKKQLEDENNSGIYEDIIKEATEEKISLEERKGYLKDKLKRMKSNEEISKTIMDISKIYKEKHGNLDNSEKEMFLREILSKIVIGKEDIKLYYVFSI